MPRRPKKRFVKRFQPTSLHTPSTPTIRPAERENQILYVGDGGQIEHDGGSTIPATGPVTLAVEVIDRDGGNHPETRTVSLDRIKEAQRIIQEARDKPEQQQMEAINQSISILYPYQPRDGQREALHHLIYHKQDLILIAKTSFGKSMILQAVSVLLGKTLTLVLLPLKQIGAEQTQYIQQLGGQPCFLNKDTMSNTLLKKICEGQFTNVLISPELAIGDRFRRVAISPSFQGRLCLVVIDEAYLVSHWGRSFRPAYARLNQLRSMLGPKVPWFACSATLERKTLVELRQNITFQPSLKIQRNVDQSARDIDSCRADTIKNELRSPSFSVLCQWSMA